MLRHVPAALLVTMCSVTTQAWSQTAAPPGRTYVIVHGAWGGGWDWRVVDSLLTQAGHRVHRVTLTGLGERVHLASADIGLETHLTDVVNAIAWEGLTDVVLVGHSYGGMVITGAADRLPERLRALIYIDAFLPDSGESVVQLTGGGLDALVARSRNGLIPAPWATADAIPRDVPHPLRTFTDTLVLVHPEARRIPASYILTVDEGATDDMFSPYAGRATARGWPVHRMVADHTPERSKPGELVALLQQIP
jgi:pimeloyl-ACP methyl ester carboxylesterase